MSKEINQGQGDQTDIDVVFSRTIEMIRDDTQRVINTPTELDEVGETARKEALRQLGENAVHVLEQRRLRFKGKGL